MEEKDATENLNALQDNIRRKGTNAYYYAHSKSRDLDIEGVHVCDDIPQKLSVAPTNTAGTVNSNAIVIKRYSWADFKKSVRIYIDLEGIDELPEENVSIEFKPDTEESPLKVRLRKLNKDGDHELHIGKLHDKVSEVTFKKKDNNRLVIFLKKANDFTWYELAQK